MVVVDIQGVNDFYTDPQIHVKLDRNTFADGNLAFAGLFEWMEKHECNSVCETLGMEPFDKFWLPKDPNEAENDLAEQTRIQMKLSSISSNSANNSPATSVRKGSRPAIKTEIFNDSDAEKIKRQHKIEEFSHQFVMLPQREQLPPLFEIIPNRRETWVEQPTGKHSLPFGWELKWNDDKAAYFYVCHSEKRSQWEDPRKPEVAITPAPPTTTKKSREDKLKSEEQTPPQSPKRGKFLSLFQRAPSDSKKEEK